MLIYELSQFSTLRAIKPASLVTSLGPDSRALFADMAATKDAVPVIIPARNEQNDLPATLRTLANSDRAVRPLVVNNCSNDLTAERAQAMGATVLDCPNPGKMGATQLGINYALDTLGCTKALFTDGDSLLRPGWASAMESRLTNGTPEKGVGVWGLGVFMHGESIVVDAARTLVFAAKETVGRLKGRLTMATGCNYGLSFDSQGKMQSEINSLDPSIFCGDDRAIRDAALSAGARIVGSLSLSLVVITRGDRVSRITDLAQSAQDREYGRHQSYAAQYGEMPEYRSPLG